MFSQQAIAIAYGGGGGGEESSSSSCHHHHHQLLPTTTLLGYEQQRAAAHYHQPDDGFDPNSSTRFATILDNSDLNDHLKPISFMELLVSKGGIPPMLQALDSPPSLSVEAGHGPPTHPPDSVRGFPDTMNLLLRGETNQQQNGSFGDFGNKYNLASYNSNGNGLLDNQRQGHIPFFAPSTPNTNNLVSPEAYSVAAYQNMFTSPQEENADSASSRTRASDLQVHTPAHHDNTTTTQLAYNFHQETTASMIPEEVDAAAALNKLNQQKPRRKKHRPKVVKENQTKRGPKPQKPPVVDPNTPPKVRKTYVRRNKTPAKTPPAPTTTTPPLKERAKPLPPRVQKASAKRALSFAEEDLSTRDDDDDSSSSKANAIFQSDQPQSAGNVHHNEIQSSSGQFRNYAYADANTTLPYTTNQVLKDYIPMPERFPLNQPTIQERPLQIEQDIGRNFGVATRSVNGHSAEEMLLCRELYDDTNSLQVTFIPEICKKRRTGKTLKPNKTSTVQSVPYFSSTKVPSSNQETTPSSNEEKQYTCWADLDRLKKKRSRSSAPRARPLDSLNTMCRGVPPDSFDAPCKDPAQPATKKRRKYTRKQAIEALTTPPSCEEALAGVVAKRATRRRSKPKAAPAKYRHPYLGIRDRPNFQGTFLALPRLMMTTVDDIAEWFQQLHITQKGRSKPRKQSNAIIPYQEGRGRGRGRGRRRNEQQALVVYRRDGTIVASNARRKKSRARVDLDNETERVWKLLLLDINSEGIDGTDEEKAKWWEKERKTFHGRVDSFIGRMNDVQGQRKFSPWKGSVVDSVVGVFLTQNVSDHLSSSAFMSMVARFPATSGTAKTSYEVAPLIEEPEDCEGVTCNDTGDARSVEEPVYIKILHEFDSCYEKEILESKDCYCASSPDLGSSHYVNVTNNNEAKSDESRIYKDGNIASNTQTATDLVDAKTEDVTSSQQSVVSSQNSANSPSAPQVTIEGNSDLENLTLTSSLSSLDGQTSFVALLSTMHQQYQLPQPHSDHIQLEGIRSEEVKHGIARSELHCNSLVDQNVSSHAHQLQQVAEFSFEVSDNDSMFVRNSQENDGSCRTENTAGTSSMLHGVSGTDQELTASSYVYGDNWTRSSPVINTQQTGESIFSNNFTKTDDSCKHCDADQSAGTTKPTSQPFPFQQENSSKRLHEPKCYHGACTCYVLEGEEMVMKTIKQSVKGHESETELPSGQESSIGRNEKVHDSFGDSVSVTQSPGISTSREYNGSQPNLQVVDHDNSSGKSTDMVKKDIPTKTKSAGKAGKAKGSAFDWDSLRRDAQSRGISHERTRNTMDSVNWEAVRCADVKEIAHTIKERGMNNVLAERIQSFLTRLVKDHGSIDLEWLRDVPPDKAKEYLLSMRGLGLKSVECVRLLTLHHLAFPVDTNVGRIAVRLGWVPLQPLPESLQLHLLELYPVQETIQKYLWPRLCKLDQQTLYELHYHMITFGKVFCTKKQPNCNACPLRAECRHFASAFASARLSLPGPEQQSVIAATQSPFTQQDARVPMNHLRVPLPLEDRLSGATYETQRSESVVELPTPPEPIVELPASPEPIVEVPASPEPDQTQTQELDIEDYFDDDPNEIPTIKLNIQQFSQNLQSYIQSMELDNGEICRALVALAPEAASIPTPKLKNVSRLRTEHHVYELPDTHILLEGLPRREQDDPCPYLLAVWTPGETADSTQPPERRCNPEEPNQLCNDETCFYCSGLREAQSQMVRATLLIPCRTAMRGSFPLNGTYFQVNEVFADHDSSLDPMNVPRGLIWHLPRRTVYFGTSIPTIFRGLSTIEIQQCFYKGYVCVRGFDQKTRAPRPLKARLHFPQSKKTKSRGKNSHEDDE